MRFKQWIEHDYLYDDLDKRDNDSEKEDRVAASQDFIAGSREVPNPHYDPNIPMKDGSFFGNPSQEYQDQNPDWEKKIRQFNHETIPAKINLGNKRIVLSKYRHPPIAFPLNNKDVSEDKHHGRKPYGGLWYAFGSDWIRWSEQVPARLRMFVHEIKINNKVLILKDKNDKSLFEQKYGKQVPSYYGQETLINWPDVAKDYGGIEVQSGAMNRNGWQEDWDIASGCIWGQDAIADTKLLYVYDVNNKKYVSARELGVYGGYSSRIKNPLPPKNSLPQVSQ